MTRKTPRRARVARILLVCAGLALPPAVALRGESRPQPGRAPAAACGARSTGGTGSTAVLAPENAGGGWRRPQHAGACGLGLGLVGAAAYYMPVGGFPAVAAALLGGLLLFAC